MPPPPFLLILPKKNIPGIRQDEAQPSRLDDPQKRRKRMKWDDMKENKGRVGRQDKKKGKEKQKGVGNEKQFWRGENMSKKKKYSFPWSWQNMRISQLSLKQIDKDEHMRADGRARAKIEIRVYVLKRAEYCECKGRKIWSRDRENTHSHIHIWLLWKQA